jgi:hypothetical protein
MAEDQAPEPKSAPLKYDPEKFERRMDNLLGSFRAYREDSATAFGKAADANKEIASFYEKLMLLGLGTIGLSVTALISFVSKFALTGSHKIVIVSLASVAWGLLFVSAFLCSRVIFGFMAANKRLLYQWLINTSDDNCASIMLHISNLGNVFSGTSSRDGEPYDPKTELSKLATDTKNLFESSDKEHLRKAMEQLKLQPPQMGKFGGWAVVLLQSAFLLLAITTVALFAGM